MWADSASGSSGHTDLMSSCPCLRLFNLPKRGYEQLRRLQELLPKTVICRTLTATLRVNASSSLQFAGSLHLATVRRIALICNIQINVDTGDFRDVAIAVARVGLHASLSVSCISGTL